MASVYLARVPGEMGFSRIYALKVMHPELATEPELVTMLMDEAKLAARLGHPNVVSTVDLGAHDGQYFIAMEYVDGIALDRLLRRTPELRPPRLLVPIAMDALRGLAAAHALADDDGVPLGLVHRDVTPGNILVGVNGQAHITDFGIAKARARATKTNPGIVKGKAGYVAPEVALGKAIDARADVFSMGVLLWNALTGETLYDTNNLGVAIHELMSKEVPPPSTVGLKPSALFDQPILTALKHDPDERHHSANEMADALADALLMAGGEPPRREIGEWVEVSFASLLDKRRELSDPEIDEPAPQRRDPTRPLRVKRDIDIEIEVDDPVEDDSAPTEMWEVPEGFMSEPAVPVPLGVDTSGPPAEPPPSRASTGYWIALSVLVLALAAVVGVIAAWLIQNGLPTF